ncbi:MAG: NAD(P)H-dependent glycerol-3-phosphate dehydrogenase [Actinomycetes bacterium]
MKVAVMGAGSWGTAYSMVLAEAGNQVWLWGRNAELCAEISTRRVNSRYLPEVLLPEAVTATSDPQSALAEAELVVLALPSQTVRDNLRDWGPAVPQKVPVVSLMKGLELQSRLRMSQVVSAELGTPASLVVVVSGPNLAREIAAHQPAATVVACTDEAVARRVQAASLTATFRPYTNRDVVGVELGGVVKNVIALATGMAEGMGFGDNTKASIITRGLAEMTRLGVAMGADPLTFAGLAGVGDLVATCMSPLSRNRTFGENLGRGMSLEEVTAATHQTAEGVKSSRAVLDLALHHHVDMPIAEHVVAVVHEGMTPKDMVRSIMSRETKAER